MRFESERCRWLSRALGLLVAVGFPLASPAALAADRVALVVGNSAYTAIGALPNPGNDATDVAAALGRLGFDVTTVRDADRVGLSEALRVFTRESAGADVSLVFYAGHGLEMDGVNYLVPVDAQLERDTDVRFEAVDLDDVLAATTGAGLRIVILDACRNNPLARSMQRTGASRNVSRGSFGELDENLLGDETLVAYAAAAGTTAADGTGRNSPYTTALLEYLEQPLEIGILFREVRGRVLKETGGEQRPHEYASLLGEHYLRGASEPGTQFPPSGLSTEAWVQQENLFWESISNSADPADYQAYLDQFPSGVFERLARNRLRALAGRPVSRDPPPVPPSEAADLAAAPPLASVMAGREFHDCEGCPELVVIPAGTLSINCESDVVDCSGDQQSTRDVVVGAFALAKYEVTRAQFAAFVSATGHAARGCTVYVWTDPRFAEPRWEWKTRRETSWSDPGFAQGDNEPVVCVRAQDAQAYVEWLSAETGEDYRLPSGLEWIHAARAGTTEHYWRGEGSESCAYGNGADRTARAAFENQKNAWRFSDCADGAARTTTVGSFAPNDFGLHDMAGNVMEWTEDCWTVSYSGEPAGVARARSHYCDHPALRGGSWASFRGGFSRPLRMRNAAENRYDIYGFRVARSLGAP